MNDQIKYLCAGLSIATDSAEPVSNQVIEIAQAGKTVEAIKLLRKERKGMTLTSAARIVMFIQRSLK